MTRETIGKTIIVFSYGLLVFGATMLGAAIRLGG